MDILVWISKWRRSHFDGDWEHEHPVKIESLDNPGWIVSVAVSETVLENVQYDSGVVEKDEHDWYSIKVKDAMFQAAGDNEKLTFLLESFKNLLISHGEKID